MHSDAFWGCTPLLILLLQLLANLRADAASGQLRIGGWIITLDYALWLHRMADTHSLKTLKVASSCLLKCWKLNNCREILSTSLMDGACRVLACGLR